MFQDESGSTCTTAEMPSEICGPDVQRDQQTCHLIPTGCLVHNALLHTECVDHQASWMEQKKLLSNITIKNKNYEHVIKNNTIHTSPTMCIYLLMRNFHD